MAALVAQGVGVWLLVVSLLAGCQPSPRPQRTGNTDGVGEHRSALSGAKTAQTEQPRRHELAAQGADDTVTAAWKCRSDSQIRGPRLLTRFIDEPESPLRVTVTESTGGGTMHYAEQIQLVVPAAAPFVREADVARGQLLPLLRRRAAATVDRDVLLGWSSSGGGQQTMVAWLVARGGPPRLVDALEVQQRRADALLLVRKTDGALQLGVPAPRDPAAPTDGPWLRTHHTSLPADRWSELPYEPLPATAAVEAFCPPFGKVGQRPARVAWLSIGETGFVVPER